MKTCISLSGRYSPDRMISDLKSRLQKEKSDEARTEKVSSLTRGLDGRIVMNIKDDAPPSRRQSRPNPLGRRRKEKQEVTERGTKYLGEVYSHVTPAEKDIGADQPDARPRRQRRSSRPSSRHSSRRSSRSRSVESRKSERSSRRQSRAESHVR